MTAVSVFAGIRIMKLQSVTELQVSVQFVMHEEIFVLRKFVTAEIIIRDKAFR